MERSLRSRSAHRTWVAAALVLTTACGGGLSVQSGRPAAQVAAPAPTPSSSPSASATNETSQQDVLDQIAAAFLAGDADGVAAHLYEPESAFGVAWTERGPNMAALPLASYELELDSSLPDLATDAVRERYPDGVQVRYVAERFAIEGFDDEPASEDLFLTFVPDEDGWKVASDRDAEALGLVSADHLWDHGPVEFTPAGAVAAIHHPDGPEVGPLLEEAGRALAAARERWPRAWPERVPIIVPRDEEELGELLHVTFDLSNFVAFATATPVGELDSYELTGSRIVLNPERFLSRSSSTRELILIHELVHVATRPSSGPMVPSWLEEGVAQALGERRSTTGTRLVDALATSSVTLPTDGQFTVGGRDRIFLSYQLAWSFVDYLTSAYGDDQVAAFYAAAGSGAAGEPGNEAWQTDRAAREVFGKPLTELVEEWRTAR